MPRVGIVSGYSCRSLIVDRVGLLVLRFFFWVRSPLDTHGLVDGPLVAVVELVDLMALHVACVD